jgi:hypothetical protein
VLTAATGTLTQSGLVQGATVTETATLGDILHSGSSQAGNGGLTMTASAGSISQTIGPYFGNGTGGTISATGTGTITLNAAGNITQSGSLLASTGTYTPVIRAAYGNVTLTAGGSVQQTTGEILSTASVAVTANGTSAGSGIIQDAGAVISAGVSSVNPGDVALRAANTITLAGLVAASNNITLTASGASLDSGGIVSGTAVTETGVVSAGNGIIETATRGDIELANAGTIAALAGGIVLNAQDGSVTQSSGTIQTTGGSVSLIASAGGDDGTSGSITQTAGLITAANGSVNIAAEQSIQQTTGTIRTTGSLPTGITLTANGSGITQAPAGLVQASATAGSVTLVSQGTVSLAGTIQATDQSTGSISIAANGSSLGSSGTITAGALASLTAVTNLDNTGTITVTNGPATLVATSGTLGQSGTVSANAASLTARTNLTNTGWIDVVSGPAVLTAATGTLTQSGLVQGATVTETATLGDILHSGSSQAGNGGLTMIASAGSISQTIGPYFGNGTGGTISATGTGTIMLNAAGNITQSGSLLANSGTYTPVIRAAYGNVTLAAGGSVQQTTGEILSSASVAVTANGTSAGSGIIQDAGAVISAGVSSVNPGDVALRAANTITLAGLVAASNNVTLTAAGASLDSGGIVSGTAVTETGVVSAGNGIIETATQGDILLANTGTIAALAGGIVLDAQDGSVTQSSGTIQTTGGSVSLIASAGGDDGTSGSITQVTGLIAAANGNIALSADDSIAQNSGTIQTTGSAATTIAVSARGTAAGQGFSQAATGLIQASGTLGTVTINAANLVTQAGTVNAPDANDGIVSITAGGSQFHSGGSVTAGSALTQTGSVTGGSSVTETATRGDVALSGTSTAGAGGLTIQALDGSVSQTAGRLQAIGGAVKVGADVNGNDSTSGSITQAAGLIAAVNGDVALSAGTSIIQSSGTILTTGSVASTIALTAGGTAAGQGFSQAANGLIQASGAPGTVTINAANLVTQAGTIAAPDTSAGVVSITAGGSQFASDGGLTAGNALTQTGRVTGGSSVTETATLGGIALSGTSSAGGGGLVIQALDGSVAQTAGQLQAVNGGSVAVLAQLNANDPASGSITQSGGTIAAAQSARLQAGLNLTQTANGTISAPQMDFYSVTGAVSVAGTLSGLLAGAQQSQTQFTILASDYPSIGTANIGSTDGIFLTVGSPTTFAKQVISYTANASLAPGVTTPSGAPQLVVTVLNNEPVVLAINPADAVPSMADLFLVMQTGSASGTINVASLHLMYQSNGTTDQVDLMGTVDGQTGTNAATASFIDPLERLNYILNGCPIESSSCIRITTLQVPVTNPLRDIQFGPTPPPEDVNIMLPDVGERDY